MELIKGKDITGHRRQGHSSTSVGDHTERLREKKKDTKKIVRSMRYCAQFNKIKSLLNKHLPILYGDPTFKQLLEPGIQVVARRAPMLGMTLAPKRKSSTWLVSPGMFICRSKRCVTCSVVQISNTFTCSVTKETHQIRSYINCNTNSVVYLISCLKCHKQYVGCTMRNLKNRIREHLNSLNSEKVNSPVARHFIECNGGDTKWMSVQGIGRVNLGPRGGDLLAKLLKTEVKWIFKLHTRQPEGLNSIFDISCYF
ncbi:hypothetical protein XELAEV_18020141mg [Xenopus laevis]|uniref:GIY-YIG domain-containing protein n=1 Tax=Xenopus laevis TaxID=8355 RepID=A0A974D788_XENLA|nr:hypothetical protein XELAEV_18020141mg [Xenopus laevis]